MRRPTVAVVLAMALMIGSVGIATATPSKECPSGPGSTWSAYSINPGWEVGDPVPSPGQDGWWDLTLTGIAAEGQTPEEVAAEFGVDGVAGLYALVNLGIRGLDKNADGFVCAKDYKDTHWLPAYFFNAVDNNAREH